MKQYGSLTLHLYFKLQHFIFGSAEQGGKDLPVEKRGYIYSKLGEIQQFAEAEDKITLLKAEKQQ